METKRQAGLVKTIIKKELKKLGREFALDKKWDCEPILEVVESPRSKGWWGVEIRTDGDSYEEFYDVSNERAQNNQKKIEGIINNKMGFKDGDHYFEPYGGGILHYY